jgi:hypothetical protein
MSGRLELKITVEELTGYGEKSTCGVMKRKLYLQCSLKIEAVILLFVEVEFP